MPFYLIKLISSTNLQNKYQDANHGLHAWQRFRWVDTDSRVRARVWYRQSYQSPVSWLWPLWCTPYFCKGRTEAKTLRSQCMLHNLCSKMQSDGSFLKLAMHHTAADSSQATLGAWTGQYNYLSYVWNWRLLWYTSCCATFAWSLNRVRGNNLILLSQLLMLEFVCY